MRRTSLAGSFRAALAGIAHVFATQRNFKIECAVGVAVCGVAAWMGVSASEWAVLLLTICGVLAAEIANTSVEALIDLLSPELHPAAKIAKDAAAGGVLLMAVASVAVGLGILGPPLWKTILG